MREGATTLQEQPFFSEVAVYLKTPGARLVDEEGFYILADKAPYERVGCLRCPADLAQVPGLVAAVSLRQGHADRIFVHIHTYDFDRTFFMTCLLIVALYLTAPDPGITRDNQGAGHFCLVVSHYI